MCFQAQRSPPPHIHRNSSNRQKNRQDTNLRPWSGRFLGKETLKLKKKGYEAIFKYFLILKKWKRPLLCGHNLKKIKYKTKISSRKSKRNQQTGIAAVCFGLDSISETVNGDLSCPTATPLGTTPAKKFPLMLFNCTAEQQLSLLNTYKRAWTGEHLDTYRALVKLHWPVSQNAERFLLGSRQLSCLRLWELVKYDQQQTFPGLQPDSVCVCVFQTCSSATPT